MNWLLAIVILICGALIWHLRSDQKHDGRDILASQKIRQTEDSIVLRNTALQLENTSLKQSLMDRERLIEEIKKRPLCLAK